MPRERLIFLHESRLENTTLTCISDTLKHSRLLSITVQKKLNNNKTNTVLLPSYTTSSYKKLWHETVDITALAHISFPFFLYEGNIKECSEKSVCNDMNFSISHMQNFSIISDSDMGLISFSNSKASLTNRIDV